MTTITTIGIFLASFFLNPLFYVALLVLYIISSRRLKAERASFHTRVYSRMTDVVHPFLPALVIGLAASLVSVGIGLTVTIPLLGLLTAVYVVLAITSAVRLVTPLYALALLSIVHIASPLVQHNQTFNQYIEWLTAIPLMTFLSLMALLVLVEGVLIRWNGATYTSPRLERSNRGKWIGIHQAKRLWVVPLILFIPEGAIPTFPGWPVFTIAEMSLQPIIVPFLIGFSQRVKSTIPSIPIGKMGLQVILLSVLAIGLTVATFFYPSSALALATVFVTVIGRELLFWTARDREQKGRIYFSNQQKGCIVLGVLPNSPAAKMNIAIGETIVKVNGKEVQDEESFYEALQLNSAFCKIDVLNRDGEVRFAQGALYDGEHHQLGVLLVKKDIDLQNSII